MYVLNRRGPIMKPLHTPKNFSAQELYKKLFLDLYKKICN